MTSPDATLFDVAALTHRGAVRQHNEDVIAVAGTVLTGDMRDPLVTSLGEGCHLVMVADGMGGHACGELASRTAVDALVAESFADEAACRRAIAAANTRIYDLMRRRPEALGMGTTLVGAGLDPGRLIHFNVGDSRAYRHAPGKLVQLSHDDVPFAAGAGRGRVSHVVTQCLGGSLARTTIDPHIATAAPLAPGETLLLCSDGLTDMVDDAAIARALEASPDPADAARVLFGLAMQAGGIDNVSIVIVRAAAGGGGP